MDLNQLYIFIKWKQGKLEINIYKWIFFSKFKLPRKTSAFILVKNVFRNENRFKSVNCSELLLIFNPFRTILCTFLIGKVVRIKFINDNWHTIFGQWIYVWNFVSIEIARSFSGSHLLTYSSKYFFHSSFFKHI